MVVHCKDQFKDSDLEYQEYFNQFPYPLSDFQKWSIFAIVNGHHSLVTAHTGSGKTLPAEFAIRYFKEKGKKVIYTGPIKALCNQKLYDFKQKFPNISFGILTGDIKFNPDAQCVIMTTEILRNILYQKESTHVSIDEVDKVIFDEVHYVNNKEKNDDLSQQWEDNVRPYFPESWSAPGGEEAAPYIEWEHEYRDMTKQVKFLYFNTNNGTELPESDRYLLLWFL